MSQNNRRNVPAFRFVSFFHARSKAWPNKRMKSAPFGRPTRNGEAPLLAAYARRYTS
jgi:hypothetical protein